MAATTTIYGSFKTLLAAADIDLTAETIKAALVDSGYTPDPSDSEWSVVYGHEVSGAGYTAGGETLANVTASAVGSNAKIDADDVTWQSPVVTFKYVVLYATGTFGGKVDPLIGYIADSSGDDVVITTGYLSLQWGSNGVILLS